MNKSAKPWKPESFYTKYLLGKIREMLVGKTNMSKRVIEDRVVTNLLLLYLIDRADREGVMEDDLKLQKSVFLAEKNLINSKMKGYSYNFFRGQHGPFSAYISDDLGLPKKNKFVNWEDDKIYLTEESKVLVETM